MLMITKLEKGFRIALPVSILEQAGIGEGALLDCRFGDGIISLIPQKKNCRYTLAYAAV